MTINEVRARRRPWGHLLFVLLMLAFTVWYFFSAFNASRAASNLIMILPVSAILAVLEIALLATEIRRMFAGGPESRRADEDTKSAKAGERSKWLYATSMGVFILLIPRIGVEASAFLFMIGTMRLLGSKSWIFTIVYSLIFALVLSYLFVSVMNLTLPSLLFGQM